MAETLDWALDEKQEFFGKETPASEAWGASWGKALEETPVEPPFEESPERALDDETILKDLGWRVDEKTGLSTNGNPVVHVYGAGADRMKGDYTGFWERTPDGHLNFVGTTSGGIGHFNTNPVGMRDPVKVYETPTGQALWLDRAVHVGPDTPTHEAILSQYIDNPNRLQREANYEVFGKLNDKKLYLTDAEIIQGTNGKITQAMIDQERKNHELLKRWNKEGGIIYPTGDKRLSLYDLLEQGAITQEQYDNYAPRVTTGGVNRPMTLEEFARAEQEVRAKLIAENAEYARYDEKPWWEKALGTVISINEFLNPSMPKPTGRSAELFQGQTPILAGGELNAILESTRALFTSWDWLPRSDVEFQKAFNKVFEGGLEKSGRDPVSAIVAGLIKDPEMTQYVLRNLNEQYQKNASTGVQIGAGVAEAILLLFIPFGGAAKAGTIIPAEARTAFMELNKAANTTRFFQSVGARAPNATELAARQAKLDRALANMPGGQEMITRLSKEAVEDSVRASKDAQRIADRISKGKPTQKLIDDFADKVDDYFEAQSRLKALQFSKYPELIADPLTKMPEFPRLPTPDDIMKTENVDNRMRELGESLGIAGRIANPQLKAVETEAGRLAYIYNWQVAFAKTLATLKVNELMALKPIIQFSKRNGLLKNFRAIEGAVDSKGRQLTNNINDLLRRPDQYIPTKSIKGVKTASDLPEVKLVHQILENRLKMLRDEGIDIELLKFVEGEHYIPHGIMQELSAAAGKTGQAFGPKAQELPRLYREIADGIAAGIRYDFDYQKMVYKTVEDSYRMVAENYFIEGARKLGSTAFPTIAEIELSAARAETTALKRLGNNIINTLKKGSTFSEKQLANIEQKSPALANSLKEGKSLAEVENVIQSEMRKAELLTQTLEASKLQNPKFITVKGVEGLEGYKFDTQLAKQLTETLKGGPVNPALSIPAQANALLRFALTAYDFGAPWIHGYALLASGHAKQWGTAVGKMIRSIPDSRYLAGYVSRNENWVRRAVTEGHMLFENSEFMAGANIMERLPGAAVHTKPFSRSFNTFLDVARLETFKSMYRPSMTAIEKAQLGSFVDKFLGNVAAPRIALSQKQSMAETLAFFAPRYYRAYAGLMGDVFRGGLNTREALKALVGLQFGTHVGFYGLAKAYQAAGGMDEEPNIIPGQPHYLQVRIGDTWVGPGSIFVSVNQTIGRLISSAFSDDDLGTKATDMLVNQPAGFLRSHLSRLAQIPIDTILGKNFMGESIVDGGFQKWVLKEIVQGSLPISAKETLDTFIDNKPQESLSTFVGNLIGLRVTPQSVSSERRAVMDQIAIDRHGVTADKLKDISYKDYLALFDDPRVQAFESEIAAQQIKKGAGWDETEKQLIAYSPKRDEVANKWAAEVNHICLQYQKGLITLAEFKEFTREWGKWYGEKIDSLDSQYPLVSKYFSEPKVIRGTNPEYIAYRTYKDYVLNNPKLNESDDGIIYSQTLKVLNDEFIAKFGQDVYDDVQQMLKLGKGMHPIWTLYSLDKNAINQSGYWDLPRGTDERNLAIKSWLQLHPDIEAKLNVWGYLRTIQTEKAERMARNELYDLGLPGSVPKAMDRVYYETTRTQLDKQIQLVKQGIHKGTYPSLDVKNMSDAGYDIIERARRNETAAKNALTTDQQDKYLDLMFKEIDNLKELSRVVSAYSHREPHLDLLELNIQSWLLENAARYARN